MIKLNSKTYHLHNLLILVIYMELIVVIIIHTQLIQLILKIILTLNLVKVRRVFNRCIHHLGIHY